MVFSFKAKHRLDIGLDPKREKSLSLIFLIASVLVLASPLLYVFKDNPDTASNDPNKSSLNETPTPTASETSKFEKNRLFDYAIKTYDVKSGIGNNIVGRRGYVAIPRNEFLDASPADIAEFVSAQCETGDYNWFTVDFGDGTGIKFAFSALLEYGNLNSEGGFSEPPQIFVPGENGLFDLSDIPRHLHKPVETPVQPEDSSN